jgi:type I restriction enzyme, S subunit
MSDGDQLPELWAQAKISDVVIVNPPGSAVVVDDDELVTFLPMAAVKELTGEIDTSIERPFADVKKGFTRFRDGDLLFAKITPCMENGKTAVVRGLAGGVGCGSTEFHVLRPADGMNADYLRYFVVRSAFRQEAKRNMQGAVGQQRVPVDFLREAELPLAPREQQQRIVSKIDELFSRIDEGERALERVQTLVERYRQSVLKAAVTGELTRVWRAQHKGKLESGEALLARILKARRAAWEKAELDKMKTKGIKPTNDVWKQKYKEPSPPDTTDLPELPEGWAWTSLPMLCTEESTSGISVKGSNEPPGVPALRLDAMKEIGFDYAARRFISISDQVAEKLAIKKGDFFISRANGSKRLVGRAVLASEPSEKIVFPDTMIRYRLVDMPILRIWLAAIWQSALLRKQIERKAKTTAGIYKISQQDIGEIAIPLPSLPEQDAANSEVEEKLDGARHLEFEFKQQLRYVASLRQAVLKNAFSGLLVKQDLYDEPASTLLERIAAERHTVPAIKPVSGRKTGKHPR